MAFLLHNKILTLNLFGRGLFKKFVLEYNGILFAKNYGKIMKERRIKDIVLPFIEGIPLQPSVEISDKITHAIEIMIDSNVNRIAVIQNQHPIGMIRLEDALHKLGIQMSPKKT